MSRISGNSPKKRRDDRNIFVLLMPRFLFFCEGFRKKNKKRGISSSLRALPSLQPTYAASLFNCSNVIC